MTAALTLVALLAAGAADVRFVAKVEPRSWHPLEPAAVEQILEQKALEELTKKGLMRLEKTGFADLKAGDYSLLIEGRFIEEAEKFSTYLTFSGGKVPAPSFHVIDTVDIGHKTAGEMQKLIVALAQRSAQRLNTLIEPTISLPAAPPPVEAAPLPVDFGEIEIPVVKQPTGAVAKLTDVKNDDYTRMNAFSELERYVFDQPNVRSAVERCALYDPSPELRARCVQGLAPVARTRLETQRLLLHAMRQEVDPGVVRAIAQVSKSFVGLSRKEAIATWLEVVSAEATPAEAANVIADLIADENNVPNLTLAVTRCLNQETMVYGKKSACAQHLLPKVPKEQRVSVIYRYLETAQHWGIGAGNIMSDIEQHVFDRGSTPLDPTLAALIQRVVTERRLMHAQATLIYALRRHPKPTPETVETMLQVVLMNHNPFFVWNSLSEMLRKHPELKATAILQLKRFGETHALAARPTTAHPDEDLRELIKKLEK